MSHAFGESSTRNRKGRVMAPPCFRSAVSPAAMTALQIVVSGNSVAATSFFKSSVFPGAR